MKVRFGDSIFNLSDATVKLYNNEVRFDYTSTHGDKILFSDKELAKDAFETISTGFAQREVFIEIKPAHQNKL